MDTLVKATLTSIDTLETLKVLWNPARYQVQRRNLLQPPRGGAGAAAGLAFAGAEERFATELFVDTTDSPLGAELRNARALVDRLVAWMAPPPGRPLPQRIVFHWGSFRFDGHIERLEEEWIRFDPDGTPVRAWLSIVLRR